MSKNTFFADTGLIVFMENVDDSKVWPMIMEGLRQAWNEGRDSFMITPLFQTMTNVT